MGGGESGPEGYTQEQLDAAVRAKGLEKENENLRENMKMAQRHRDEQRQAMEDWQTQNAAQMEKYMETLAAGGQRDKGLDADVLRLETANADAERKLKEQEENCATMQKLVELKEKDVDQAVKEATILNEKYQQLEKDKEDWKKAEEEKSEKLMKESPPPLSLRKNPPNMTPLFTHDMACFAVMGRAGTGKSTMINTLAEAFGMPLPKEKKLKTSSLAETTMGCPAPVFLKNSKGRDFALFDRPGVGLQSLKEATGEGDKQTNFISNQGLKWWTAIILNIDRDCTPEEAIIYSMCKAIGTPIIVTRNKATEAFEKEKKDCEKTGEKYDEANALETIETYITNNLHVDPNGWLLIDTLHPDKYEWPQLLEYLEEHIQKQATDVAK